MVRGRILRAIAPAAPLLVCTLFSSSAYASEACPQIFFRGLAPAVIERSLANDATKICYSSFSVLASGISKTGLWSAEHLTRLSVESARRLPGRHGRWHADVHLSFEQGAAPSDYTHSGFDRGHLSPSGDMPTPDSDAETFTMANVAPQLPHLNRGSWERAESLTRDIAVYVGEIWVVTGVIFMGDDLRQIGGRVLVPTAFYKALYMPGRGAAAYLATNEEEPRWRTVSIAEIKKISGIDPFPGLPEAVKVRLTDLPMPGQRRRRVQ